MIDPNVRRAVIGAGVALAAGSAGDCSRCKWTQRRRRLTAGIERRPAA